MGLAPKITLIALGLLLSIYASTASGFALGVEPSARPQLADSLAGRSVLEAAGVVPGARTAGEVVLANRGAAAARLWLDVTVADTAAPGRPLLSRRLRLTVADVSRPGPARELYAGPLAAFQSRALGSLAPGQARRLRLELAWPPGAGDDAYQGAGVSTDLNWTLT